eukprot:Phypoly_transcript_08847.p1 GENE.Phypoly_transcript_08847~~Phypoly_transcript_08847.p1  ORF type:complete len:280 (+),score=44.97 Phypoly_transcript_08847:131-970(+)
MSSLQNIIDSQLEYYKVRATEYDEWWERVGRYSLGEEEDKKWRDDIQSVQNFICKHISKDDKVLELACGTGNWTKTLVEKLDVSKIKCVDGAPETLEVLKGKFTKSGIAEKLNRIEFEVADLFGDWQPTGEFTAIFTGFFLTHVPPSKWAPFLAKLKAAGAKNKARLVFIDSYYTSDAHVAAKDYTLREGVKAIDYDPNEPDEKFLIYRKLNSGATHSIVKVFYEPHVLQDVFAKNGVSLILLFLFYFIFCLFLFSIPSKLSFFLNIVFISFFLIHIPL